MSPIVLRGPLGAAALALVLVAGAAHADGDPVHGKQVFNQICTGCHALSGPSFAAPPLAGVYGRKAGTVGGYKFSTAMAGSGIIWSDATLDKFLAAPGTTVVGTTMPIAVASPTGRADVIAYLKTLPAAAP